MRHRKQGTLALHSFMNTAHSAHVLWASVVQIWPVLTHLSPETTLTGRADAPAGWCYLRDPGGSRRETLCPAACGSHCHILATDVSVLLHMDWLPSLHVLTICESGSFANRSQLTSGNGGSLLRHIQPPSNALPDDISPAIPAIT